VGMAVAVATLHCNVATCWNDVMQWQWCYEISTLHCNDATCWNDEI